MTKKVWSKGRKQPHCTIAVCSESRDMANRFAAEAGMCMKEFIFTLLDRYDDMQRLKIQQKEIK